MKILISERQKNLLFENQLRDDLINVIKYDSWEEAIIYVGNIDNLKKLLNFDSPLDFLNLFNDLEVVQSVDYNDYILFRHEKGKNIITYSQKNGNGYINYYIIWSFLESYFGLNYDEIQGLTKEWLSETYNLRVTTTSINLLLLRDELSETYNLRVTTTKSEIGSNGLC
jgi:hypothetical protein